MSLLSRLRTYKFQKIIKDQHRFYSRDWPANNIKRWQLVQFNKQWEIVRNNIPYFQKLSNLKALPESFSSWTEFRELMPIMEREVIQKYSLSLIDPRKKPDFLRTTGGSTAEPVQLPAWKSELQYTNKDLWYARHWFGINPSDRLFLIWGHSHLLGEGLKGKWNSLIRYLKDLCLGYYRYSAYDLSVKGLKEAAEALITFKPAYIIAYSVALDRFAKINKDMKEEFYKLKLKAAIATAESFPSPESIEFISKVLCCPVVMEYGAVETGPIAHQKPDGKFKIFWRHFFIEGYEYKHLPGTYEILITTLYPRCLPLIRYRLGDLISENPNNENFNQEFNKVVGRCNDYIILPNKDIIHSEAFTHVVKDIPYVINYQVVQFPDRNIKFRLVTTKPLKKETLSEIKRRLGVIHPNLADITIEEVPNLEQTIAGKTRRIFRVEDIWEKGN